MIQSTMRLPTMATEMIVMNMKSHQILHASSIPGSTRRSPPRSPDGVKFAVEVMFSSPPDQGSSDVPFPVPNWKGELDWFFILLVTGFFFSAHSPGETENFSLRRLSRDSVLANRITTQSPSQWFFWGLWSSQSAKRKEGEVIEFDLLSANEKSLHGDVVKVRCVLSIIFFLKCLLKCQSSLPTNIAWS